MAGRRELPQYESALDLARSTPVLGCGLSSKQCNAWTGNNGITLVQLRPRKRKEQRRWLSDSSIDSITDSR